MTRTKELVVAVYGKVELEAAHDNVDRLVAAHDTLELAVAAHDAIGHVLADIEVRCTM